MSENQSDNPETVETLGTQVRMKINKTQDKKINPTKLLSVNPDACEV